MDEIWKPVVGYEGLYEVSSLGNVKTILTSRILKSINNEGYRQVGLYKKCIQNTIKIHILVAKTFIPNIENKPQVNHINGIKSDNRIENLEWCTSSENIRNAFNTGLKKVTRNHHFYTNHPMTGKFGKDNHLSKKVNQYSVDGKFIKTWDSMTEAGKYLGIKISIISNCCKGKKWSKTAGGFVWKFN